MRYPMESDFELDMELEDLEWETPPSGCPSEARLKLNPVEPKALTLGKVLWPATCGDGSPSRATALKVLAGVVASAIDMLDRTIGELSRAREAACSGDVMVGPSDVARCWLKYRLGVCIDDRFAWTDTSDKSGTVAEVIRRL